MPSARQCPTNPVPVQPSTLSQDAIAEPLWLYAICAAPLTETEAIPSVVVEKPEPASMILTSVTDPAVDTQEALKPFPVHPGIPSQLAEAKPASMYPLPGLILGQREKISHTPESEGGREGGREGGEEEGRYRQKMSR